MVLFAFNSRGNNGTHMHITKPKISFAKEYNYFKTSRYSIMAEVVVNSKKKIVDVYIGFFGFVNDSHVLQKIIYIGKHSMDHFLAFRMVHKMGFF